MSPSLLYIICAGIENVRTIQAHSHCIYEPATIEKFIQKNSYVVNTF